MARIKDIANKAGVSISTVSYALNGNKKIPDKTRQRIIDIANEMHYTPNLAGRTLKKQKTNIIGMYVSDFGGYFYSDIIDGAAKFLKDRGYEVIVGSGGNKSRDFIPQKLVDGAIILDTNFSSRLLDQYANDGCPIVVMDRQTTNKNIKHVLLDNVSGVKQVIKALGKTHAEHFIMITGPSASYDSRIRSQTALTEFEQQLDSSVLVIPSDFTIEGGRLAAQKILKSGLNKNLGIFALNDELAIGLHKEFQKNNIDIGKNVKIVGFDNDLLGKYLTPTLTTVSYSKHEWGKEAAKTVLNMINHNKVDNIFVKTELIHRNSLGENNI